MRVSAFRVFNNVSRNLGLREYNKHVDSWAEWVFEAEQYIGSKDTFERAERTYATETALQVAKIKFTDNSLDKQYITINGTKFVFRNLSSSAYVGTETAVNEISVGADLDTTLDNAVAVIDGSYLKNAIGINASYTAGTNVLELSISAGFQANPIFIELDVSDALEITQRFTGAKNRIQNKQITLPNDLIKLLNVRVGDDIIEPSSSQFRSKISDQQDRYYVEGNRLNFSRKYSKDVVISYLRAHTDENGYPTVRQGHEEAVAFYIMWKHKSIDYYSGNAPQYIIKDLERRWYHLCAKVRGDDNMPSSLELLKIGKIWNAKVPITSHNPPLYDGLNSY